MLWDATWSYDNPINGKPYVDAIKAVLEDGSSSGGGNALNPAPPAATVTKSKHSSPTRRPHRHSKSPSAVSSSLYLKYCSTDNYGSQLQQPSPLSARRRLHQVLRYLVRPLVMHLASLVITREQWSVLAHRSSACVTSTTAPCHNSSPPGRAARMVSFQNGAHTRDAPGATCQLSITRSEPR